MTSVDVTIDARLADIAHAQPFPLLFATDTVLMNFPVPTASPDDLNGCSHPLSTKGNHGGDLGGRQCAPVHAVVVEQPVEEWITFELRSAEVVVVRWAQIAGP